MRLLPIDNDGRPYESGDGQYKNQISRDFIQDDARQVIIERGRRCAESKVGGLHLACDQAGAASRQITVTGGRAAFNDAGIVAGDNHGGTVMTTPRASHFVAHARNASAARVAHRRAFDHNAAMTCFIAN